MHILNSRYNVVSLTTCLLIGFLCSLHANAAAPKDLPWRELNRVFPEIGISRQDSNPGFLRVNGEKFVFDNGNEARFWGVNLQAYALFGTSRENVRKHARRMAAMGINLVRFHHHDSPWVVPNLIDYDDIGRAYIREESIEKLDWWIHCLAAEGIYIWLDLHSGRVFNKEEKIAAFSETRHGGRLGSPKGYLYVNASMQDKMLEFAKLYLTHRNSYSGLEYRNDPAIAMILVNNENDLTRHFGANMHEREAPLHNKNMLILLRQWKIESDYVGKEEYTFTKGAKQKLQWNFLEASYYQRMQSELRKIGVRVPVSGASSWGKMGPDSLPSLASGDFIDVHIYGEPQEIEIGPKIDAGMVHWVGAAQVAGKPLTVSEWNTKVPKQDGRDSLPIWLAAVGVRQGWDAMLQYGYSQRPLNGPGSLHDDQWSQYNDYQLLAMMPASSYIFRNKLLPRPDADAILSANIETLLSGKLSVGENIAIRDAIEKHRFSVDMSYGSIFPWLSPDARNTPGKERSDFEITVQPPVKSRPGAQKASSSEFENEFFRDVENRQFIARSSRILAVSGDFSKKPIFRDIGGYRVRLQGGKGSFSMICISGRLASCTKGFLTAVASDNKFSISLDYPSHQRVLDVRTGKEFRSSFGDGVTKNSTWSSRTVRLKPDPLSPWLSISTSNTRPN
ncbi:hypothetical protein [Microbulbifer sp. YPW1]|uniref:hypothetical protein n=1 Tax=Microbulbifer sp. YPW1 TaxID=2745199 RepID=UPI00159A7041|nr:hypothetical protein [Microbulbifer sp. YPW1]QKX16585.1 hypothetical protein HUW35_06040 [Microbulbifer sp. YPW1]